MRKRPRLDMLMRGNGAHNIIAPDERCSARKRGPAMWGIKFVQALICSFVLLQLNPVLADQAAPRQATGGSKSSGARPASASPTDVAEARLRLNDGVRRVLDQYYDHAPNSRDDSPWTLLHWSIAYGIDSQVRVGGPRGDQVSAIGWLCENRASAGMRLMSFGNEGLQLPIAPGKQGHSGQFLAMLAQSRVPRDFQIQLDSRRLTVADLALHEKDACQTGAELTFKLIGISHYGGSEDVWTNHRGEPWSLRRLLEEELKQPISSRSTCGGTHRLFALSYAVHCRRREGLPVNGPWERAAKRAEEYQALAFRLQNNDGSFSTAWFDRKESGGSMKMRLATSGHVVEWLAFSLPQEQLHDERFQKGLNYIVTLLETSPAASADWGALTHALHALAIFERRELGASPGQRRRQWLEANAFLGKGSTGFLAAGNARK